MSNYDKANEKRSLISGMWTVIITAVIVTSIVIILKATGLLCAL